MHAASRFFLERGPKHNGGIPADEPRSYILDLLALKFYLFCPTPQAAARQLRSVARRTVHTALAAVARHLPLLRGMWIAHPFFAYLFS